MKVHLVDGSFELFRCFHGAPRARDPEGREVGAVRGLVATLASLLRRHATHVAVVFDPMAPPRGTRSGDGEALASQGIRAMDAVRALGIELWPMTRYQADDGLASGAALLRDRVEQVVICTTDKDLLQCTRGARVVVWDRIRDAVTDEDGVRARFGVAPSQIPDLFALIGDPSDGLPGVPGFGPRAAAAALDRWTTLDRFPSDPDAWAGIRGGARLAASWSERHREALLGRDLSRLREDLPVPADLGALEWRGPAASLQGFLDALGDPELARWVPEKLADRAGSPPG